MFGEPCRIQMPVNFTFLAVEPRGYFAVQSGHDMRLPQGGWGCNDGEGVSRCECGIGKVRRVYCDLDTEGGRLCPIFQTSSGSALFF
jgi:hypothetical protein